MGATRIGKSGLLINLQAARLPKSRCVQVEQVADHLLVLRVVLMGPSLEKLNRRLAQANGRLHRVLF
jgi:hypothetical protein